MAKVVEKGIEILQRYFSTFPQPESLSVFGNSFLLQYNITNPYTNSRKSLRKLYVPDQPLTGLHTQNIRPESLKYEEKPNRLTVNGSEEGWLVDEKQHEELLQDPIFGGANKSQNGNRWAYVAKMKPEKTKSYFSQGEGNVEYVHDYGEGQTGNTHNSIFVYDKTTKKTLKIPNERNLIVACPYFMNSEGSQLVFHAYNREHFGHGFIHCFNRATTIYVATLEGEEFKVEKLPSEARTNMFPSVSRCGNYLAYFSGDGRTHCYYMTVEILKKTGDQWQPYHQLKDFFIGTYADSRVHFYQVSDKPFFLVQTDQKALNLIYSFDVENKVLTNYSQNKKHEVFTILSLDPHTNFLAVKYANPSTVTFGYSYLPGPITLLPSESTEEVEVEESEDPIPHFVLRKKGSEGKQPLVILIHGGPHGAADPTLTCFKYLYLSSGYTVLIPNYSGSVGYGQKHLENALGRIGDTEGKEITQCISRLVAEGKVDSKKVFSYGGSYGGYMGGILASKFSEFFRGAVLLNPVLSLPFMIGTSDIPEWCVVEGLNKSDSLNFLDEDDYMRLFQASPIAHPPKIPLRVFIGGKDRRVPHQAAKIYVAMAKAQGVDAKLYHYAESDHKLVDSVETEVDVILKSFKFIEEACNSEIDQPQ